MYNLKLYKPTMPKKRKYSDFKCPRCGGDHPLVRCTNMICYACNERGHEARSCTNRRVSCWLCGEDGHVRKDCPTSRKRRKSADGGTGSTSSCGEASASVGTPTAAGSSTGVGSESGNPTPTSRRSGLTGSLSASASSSGGASASPSMNGVWGRTTPGKTSDFLEAVRNHMNVMRSRGLMDAPSCEEQLERVRARRRSFEAYVSEQRSKLEAEQQTLEATVNERNLVRDLLAKLDQAVTTSVATVSASTLSVTSASAGTCTSTDVLSVPVMSLQTCEHEAVSLPSVTVTPSVMSAEQEAQTEQVTVNVANTLPVPAKSTLNAGESAGVDVSTNDESTLVTAEAVVASNPGVSEHLRCEFSPVGEEGGGTTIDGTELNRLWKSMDCLAVHQEEIVYSTETDTGTDSD